MSNKPEVMMYQFEISNRNGDYVMMAAKNPREAVESLLRIVQDDREITNYRFIGQQGRKHEILFSLGKPVHIEGLSYHVGDHKIVVKCNEGWGVSLDDGEKWTAHSVDKA
jgi:hypothetical protein